MRLAGFFLLTALTAFAQDDKKAVLAPVNNLFAGMSTHDAELIKSSMTPDAKLVSARDGKITTVTGSDFAQRIAANKNPILERIWEPTVLIRGSIATVWAEYDFYSAGKFGHCGIDAFTLLKGDDGWKISGIQYTTETENCKPSPLGPPKAN